MNRSMAAFFVDDGGPDAEEYATNYVWFDGSDPADRDRAWLEANELWRKRQAWLANRTPRIDLVPLVAA